MYIYLLRCPVLGVPRYVGQTVDLEQRLRSHLSKARSGQTNHHCANWIKKLLSQGLMPAIELVEVVSEEDVDACETKQIADHWSLGYPLTNSTAGGDGFRGMDPKVRIENWRLRKIRLETEPDFRERCRAAIARGKEDPAVRAKMSVSTKASWDDPEMRARYIAGMNEPEAIARRSAASSKRAEDPAYIANLSERGKAPERVAQLLQAAAIARADPEMEARRSAAIRDAYTRPEVKANLAAAMVEINARPEVKQAKSEAMLALWADPAKREEFVAAKQKPETRKKMSESAKARWADPEKAKAARDALHTPERIQRAIEVAAWKASPEYRAMRAKKGRDERAAAKAKRLLLAAEKAAATPTADWQQLKWYP